MKQKLFRLMLLVVSFLMIGNLQAQKKVHTIGDSTMATYDENTETKRGWGTYFGNFLTNGWTSVNYAKGGRDSRGGYNELWQNAKNNVNEGDYVIIQFAHNDGKYNGVDNLELQAYYTGIGDATNAAAVKSDGRGTTPSTTYKACLKQIIDEVKAKGATPILVSAVSRCYFSGETITKAGQHNLADKFSVIKDGQYLTEQKLTTDDHSMDYTYQMQQLATAEGVAFINMTEATADLYVSYGSAKCHDALFCEGDNTHYNLTGALMVARLCAQKMKEAGILADNIVIPTDLAFNPAAVNVGDVYVGQSGVKELTLTGLGLDPATGTATITATEGILLSTDKENWSTSLTADYESGTLIKTIYAKVNITAAGAFTGTITATVGDKSAQAAVTVNGIELGGGDPFTATWALTASDAAVVDPTGLATAADAKVEGMVKYGNNATYGLMVSTSDGGAWAKAEDDSPNQYVQFTVTAPDGKKLDINQLGMKVMATGGNGMRCHVYYSTDGFVNRTAIFAPASMTNKEVYAVDATPVVSLEEGDQLQIRIYPWYTGNATGKWICVKDVVVGGQSKDAAGVNISGTISYALDKGGLKQEDDVVFDPTTLSAGFIGKSWTAGNSLTVDGTLSYDDGTNKTAQTKIYNGTGASFASSAGVDNTLTLTLTPEDGFTFVPSKVSFEAARYGTDGGNISAAVTAGEKEVELVSNAEVNRSGKSLALKSFTKEVSGVTATADAPLKLNFSFLGLGKTKSMGLSNVVIEGTLVGAAVQVTKFLLTTAVEPVEAGSISREPDLEQYKEGSVVTLTATKNFGYKFKEWQDATGAVVSTEAVTRVTMDGEKTMKAIFEAVPVYQVTTQATNDDERVLGEVTLSPNDHDGKYEEGTKIVATANENTILKFMQWTDEYENANSGAARELTVNSDMTLVAKYEVEDFVAVFDASKTASYAYETTEGYPFAADEVWDAERNAKSSVVKVSDGSLCYSQSTGTPVVRNRQSVVLSTINGLYQNGYRSSDIAFQYQFSTKGFTTVIFTADMAAKNMAHKNWKALVSTDGTNYSAVEGGTWEMAANTLKHLSLSLPAGEDMVYLRITGDGTEMLSDKYSFSNTFNGLEYASNSECGVGNVFVIGKAVVADDNVAPVMTGTVPEDKATNVSATGRIIISYDERIESANATEAATLNGTAIEPTWNSRSVSFDYSNLEYGQQYTFKMPAGFVQDRSGNKDAEEHTIVFTVMNRPTVEKGLYDAVVSTVEELSAAITAANSRTDKNTRYRIFVKKGTYKLPTGASKHYTHTGSDGTVYWEGDLPDPITYVTGANISLIGEDRAATIVTQDITNDADMLFTGQFGQAHVYEEIGNSAVLQLESSATGMYFQDITIKSGINDNLGRNLAVHDKSIKTIYKNTLLYGYQDTWTSNNNNGLYYFEGGQVRGRTDYLCGKGDAYFNGLELLQVKGGYAAVPSTPKNIGWVFKDCIFSGDGSGVSGNYTLGRPWGKGTPVAVFIDTKMNVIPSAIGWNEMSNGWPKRFAEYNSMTGTGAAVDLSGRKKTFGEGHENNPVLTQEEADNYSDMNAMFGDWQPTLATEQAPVPQNVTATGDVITWDDSNYALLWAICKDGNVVDFTTTPSYTATEAGDYSVRAANEMGGLSEASATVNAIATGISNVQKTNADIEAVYSVDGKRLNKMQQGVNIVRSADGLTTKVIR